MTEQSFGAGEVATQYADLDGDGYDETMVVDTDGDGDVEVTLHDLDQDSVVDAVLADIDDDGVADVAAIIDTTGSAADQPYGNADPVETAWDDASTAGPYPVSEQTPI